MTRIAWLGMIALAAACDGPSTGDGGPTPDAGPDASMTRCQHDRDCGDTSLFCSRPRCRVGDPSADAQGCVDLGAPCEAGQTCVEASASCGRPAWCTEGREGCARPGDCDGDGAQAPDCGGDDCDDADGDRFPGNPEVCDAEGHDEDCDPETLGGTDADADGFVSAACCNTVYGACGDDCDDADPSVNPAARDVCNGRDDDCDGLTDASDEPLCPGGLCISGSCRIDAWERVFGNSRHNYVIGLAVDGAARVTAVAHARGTLDFGGPPPAPDYTAGIAVVQYEADGAYAWDAPIDICGGLSLPNTPRADIVAGPTGTLYIAACCSGGGVSRSIVQALRSDGTLEWTSPAFAGCAASIDLSDTGLLLVGGYASGTTDLGGGVTTTMDDDGFLLELNTDGAYQRELWVNGPDREQVRSVSALPGGGVALGVTVTFGTAPLCFTIGSSSHCEDRRFGSVVALTEARAVEWVRTLGTLGSSTAQPTAVVASGSDGTIVAGGHFAGTLSLGGTVLTASGPDPDGVVVAFDAAGAFRWQRQLSSPGKIMINDIDVGSDGTVAVTGAFSQTVTLAGTPSGEGRMDRDLYAVWYSPAGAHLGDAVAGGDGNDDSVAIAVGEFRDTAFGGVFMGMTSLGGRPYTSAGQGDAFIVRTTY